MRRRDCFEGGVLRWKVLRCSRQRMLLLQPLCCVQLPFGCVAVASKVAHAACARPALCPALRRQLFDAAAPASS